MNSKEIRQTFLDFFASKQHQIVASAPMVVKNDPTLMFTNAGMNQFKDIFLGNSPVKSPRIADTQKCLRVSGKHNDLEEVGHDTYHHTMFEMLGNWSFGDYFKKEAVNWAWELLVGEFKISPERLYATVFEGDETDGVAADEEARGYWKQYLADDHILNGNKKDNFWEMGDTGPCGPCSEVHVDLRDEHERVKKDGRLLVNKDHPQVIEIWNLVFIQYNRKASGKLEELPAKHVDTGMGFERLCMVLQGKQSNYDTDVFQPIIKELGNLAGVKYGDDDKTDIAMRVVADHLRAIAFSITDGQLPSNNKAGYVIRRILRRAVRYGYTFLNFRKPFIFQLVPVLIQNMGEAFPELKKQEELVTKVIHEEEESFLRTLETGIRMLDNIIEETKKNEYKVVSGKLAFELYDTFGFPLDLTELILRENDLVVNRKEFNEAMEAQKNRSRNATHQETGDWIQLQADDEEEFIGYEHLEAKVKITRYRKVKVKNKESYQLVFNFTPFYAESGGQVGDTGYIEVDGKKISILDTQKENNLIIHYAKELPADPSATFVAHVDSRKRQLTANNHSATHLLDHVLREVLGEHVEQKGSLVNEDYLRFDFSHFQKVTDEELDEIQRRVNQMIRRNLKREEFRAVPMQEAMDMGAIALFGEKYGDLVRVIRFGDSTELCGGTHVEATGEIGLFTIVSEGSVSAGVRRIEAITADRAEQMMVQNHKVLKEVSGMLNNPKNLKVSVDEFLKRNNELTKQIEAFEKEAVGIMKRDLLREVQDINGVSFIARQLEVNNSAMLKDLAFQLKGEIDNLFLVLAAEIDGKANLHIMISDALVKERGFNAGKLIRDLAKHVKGGGGGQPFYATAGGKEPAGIPTVLEEASNLVNQ
ncbi:alanine--tRNA ligase [Prolixibacter denitrificans]|uniref:Alanine--tRNA ligase n=1 Tax=Prolixibacter denitrificans TaxID=1541063 RepID=A0A2P8C908_9BACT|nr:alanine--tRNA ligase [Prolixibacter denitrificans]PSK81441.1 alanyl-tRNA synthetase [Prolixibacter denitrificans]GET21089.1 alanine--tRNA ligase [Prolixibacter denitrificans]